MGIATGRTDRTALLARFETFLNTFCTNLTSRSKLLSVVLVFIRVAEILDALLGNRYGRRTTFPVRCPSRGIWNLGSAAKIEQRDIISNSADLVLQGKDSEGERELSRESREERDAIWVQPLQNGYSILYSFRSG